MRFSNLVLFNCLFLLYIVIRRQNFGTNGVDNPSFCRLFDFWISQWINFCCIQTRVCWCSRRASSKSFGPNKHQHFHPHAGSCISGNRIIRLLDRHKCKGLTCLSFQGVLSVAMLMIKDVYILINYVSFVEALAMGVTVSGLLWLRYKQPNVHRPIRV